MIARIGQIVYIACLGLGAASVLLLATSILLNPWDHRLSLAEHFQLGLWRGRLVFFNDADYGPYRGSVVALYGDNYADVPVKTQGLDLAGINVRSGSGCGKWWGESWETGCLRSRTFHT
jgi:hypothetical protein